MECFSQAIEDACGCVIYYMPRFNPHAKVCSRANSKCYNSVRIALERGESLKYKCACLPACDELSFTGTMSSATLTNPHYQVQSSLGNFSNDTIR